MIDLSPFCSTDSGRPYLHAPFSRGEWTYATNGHVLVRVPRRCVAEVKNAPNAEKLFAMYALGEMRPLGTLKLPRLVVKQETCAECEGRGFEHECLHCTCKCEECDGTGEVKADSDDNRSVGIGGVPFAQRYVRQLMALPGLRVSIKAVPINPMRFCFDGGDGLLVPRTVPCSDHIEEQTPAVTEGVKYVNPHLLVMLVLTGVCTAWWWCLVRAIEWIV